MLLIKRVFNRLIQRDHLRSHKCLQCTDTGVSDSVFTGHLTPHDLCLCIQFFHQFRAALPEQFFVHIITHQLDMHVSVTGMTLDRNTDPGLFHLGSGKFGEICNTVSRNNDIAFIHIRCGCFQCFKRCSSHGPYCFFSLIGIAQELKAKRLIEKLTLLSQSNAKIERNGELRSVPIAEVQEQDILLLESGNQICADAVVTDGGIEVNESLLTGESDAVYKKAGDSLLSGSSVISGTCRATVLRVGSDSYASKLTKEAKKTKAMHSELVGSMQKVTRLTSFCIVPLGILLFVEALLFRDSSMYDAVVGTSAGLLGMLPKGLYLLISVSLAAGIITLSKKNVLVQDLYSLENLAHVDVLCLDKTGTLTEGKMQVEKADLFPGTDAEKFHEWMGNFLTHTQDNNATFQAMHAYFKGMDTLSVTDQIPFSSDRKWSAMTFAGAGTFVTGAPEKLCPDQMPPEITAYQKEGKRVLLAGITQQPVQKGQPLPEVQLLAVIVLTDPLRANAAKTIANFQKEGVSVKLISGDNPVTASAVAQKAGILHGDRWVDMRTVEESEIDAAAQRYTVFGRVTPQQKKQLIQAFHRQKHTVAMTGDGVNDLLALKEADCSISVGQGSDAARQTAQLVLLDSDFAVLKDVLLEGRRVVHNVTRSAGVFFIKTLYSVLLCAI